LLRDKTSDDDKVKDTDIDAIKNAITSENGNEFKTILQGIFADSDNRTELKKHDKAFLNDLKALVELIDKAYKNGEDVTKESLEAYEKGDDNKKKIWGMVNKFEDGDNKKLGDEALNKAKGKPKDSNELATAKTKAKEKMNSLVSGAGEAIIDKANLTDKKSVELVAEIFTKCHGA